VSRAGFNVQGVAYDGREAISQVEKSVNSPAPVDVVIIDQRMPHLDGFEASRRIKEIAPEVKIIMISAYDVPAARNGVVDLFIPKPVTRSQLIASLEEASSI
jgi:YesN/AraC family two-component response regulator